MALLAVFGSPYPSRPGRRDRVSTADRDSLPSGNQKRFWRDPVTRIGAVFRAVKLGCGKF
jgi:hypothetical protein